jgi:hypothetical protein
MQKFPPGMVTAGLTTPDSAMFHRCKRRESEAVGDLMQPRVLDYISFSNTLECDEW